MSFVARFLDLMPAKVQIQPFRRYSTDGSGAYAYTTGSATTYRMRITAAQKMEFLKDGQSVTPTHVAWLATTATIDPRSKFTYAGTTYRILEMQRQQDQFGAHHAKVLLFGG